MFWTSIFRIIVAFGFGITTLIFAVKSQRKLFGIAYQVFTKRHFDNLRFRLPKDASMTFEGREVERLSTSYMVIWNSGTNPLHGSEIVDTDPLRVRLTDSSIILDIDVLGSTKQTNKVVLAESDVGEPGSVAVKYDYIDSEDGIVLGVVHTSKKEPEFVGVSKGVSDGPRDFGVIWGDMGDFVRRKIPAWAVRWMGIALVACVLLTFVPEILIEQTDILATLSVGTIDATTTITSIVRRVGLGTILLVQMSIFVAYPWLNRRKYPKPLAKYLDLDT